MKEARKLQKLQLCYRKWAKAERGKEKIKRTGKKVTYRVSLRELKRLSKAFSDILNKKAKKGVNKTEHAVHSYDAWQG